jgi:hypothetical protein
VVTGVIETAAARRRGLNIVTSVTLKFKYDKMNADDARDDDEDD